MLWMIHRFLRVEDEVFVSPHRSKDNIPHVLLWSFSLYSMSCMGLLLNVVLQKKLLHGFMRHIVKLDVLSIPLAY